MYTRNIVIKNAYKNLDKFFNKWVYLYGKRPNLYKSLIRSWEDENSIHYFVTKLGERFVRISSGKKNKKPYIQIDYRCTPYKINNDTIFDIRCYKDSYIDIIQSSIRPKEIYLALYELNEIMNKEVQNKINDCKELTEFIAGGFKESSEINNIIRSI